jgi:hypothetical protein
LFKSMPRNKNLQQAILKSEDLRGAVWIDFEGNKNRPPTLLGILEEPTEYRVAILEPAFKDAESYRVRFGAVAFEDLTVVAETLVEHCEEKESFVLSWSRREILAFEGANLPPRTLSALQKVYRNGLPTAKLWLRRVFGEDLPAPSDPWEAKYQLIKFMEIMAFEVPRSFGPGHTGRRLSEIRSMLDRRADFDSLTPTKKGFWTKTVGHNWYDCHGLRYVVRRASYELEHGSGAFTEGPPSAPVRID